MTNSARVAGIQHARILGDKDANVARGLEWVRRAAGEGAEIIALPELSTTGFFPQRVDDAFFDLAEEIPGPTTDRYAALASLLGCHLIVPLFEVDAVHRTYYNAAAIIGPAGVLGRYRKAHIPAWSRGIEKYYFAPGNVGYPVFELPQCRIGVTICYDRHFPECFRHLTLSGAQIIFSVNNTASKRSLHVWEAEMVATASCNGVYLVQINACGQEGDSVFHGHSAIVSPRGEFVTKAEDGEAALVADLDLREIDLARRQFSTVRDVIWSDFGLDGRQSPRVANGALAGDDAPRAARPAAPARVGA